ncbi:MAG: hypothetical protein WB710_20250 [Stellaceae bacterium]
MSLIGGSIERRRTPNKPKTKHGKEGLTALVMPGPRVRAARGPRTSLAPGIHETGRICAQAPKSWMAGTPGHDKSGESCVCV